MINTALFREAGLVDVDGLPIYPKTWIDLAEAGKIIKDTTGAAGFNLLAQDDAAGWQFSNIALAYGAVLTTVNEEGIITCDLDSTEAIAAMEYVKSLKWNYDILTADPTIENFNTSFVQLGTGAAAMCIGANDAVDRPTLVNGLPVEDLALVPLPSGPEGDQYSLFGGTLYMFSKDATDEQINAALDYITIMGKGPVPDQDSYEAECIYRAEQGIPVIWRFPSWVDKVGIDQEKVLIDRNSNVDLRFYQDYFDVVKREGNLVLDGYGKMYCELVEVIQAVITNENADIADLMKKADENYQLYLDNAYNR
jgi:ABC-type glycerol-3-phosphate transport system substrate-binding protein